MRNRIGRNRPPGRSSMVVFILALVAAAFVEVAPRWATAQVTLIDCPNTTERTYTDDPLPFDRSQKATFVVTGDCFCSKEDPTQAMARLMRTLAAGPPSFINSLLAGEPEGSGTVANFAAAAEDIFQFGGFNTSGNEIRPALNAFLRLQRELHFEVDPDPGPDSNTPGPPKSEEVFCVTVADLAGWTSDIVREDAGQWQLDFPNR